MRVIEITKQREDLFPKKSGGQNKGGDIANDKPFIPQLFLH